MATRKIFTGGACAPGGETQGFGNNAVTNMFEHLITGSASAQQKAEGYGPSAHMANYSAMEAAYDEQQRFDQMSSQFDSMQFQTPPVHHQPLFEVSNPKVADMNDLWDQPVETRVDTTNSIVSSNFAQAPYQNGMFMPPPMVGPMFGPPMHMQPMYRPPVQTNTPEVEKEETEEVKEETLQNQKDEFKEVAGSLAQCLEFVPSDKMKNSEFVSFLKKINKGVLEINDKEMKEDPEKLAKYEEERAKQEAMEKAYRQAQLDQFFEESKDPERYFKMESLNNQFARQKLDSEFEQAFDPTDIFSNPWEAGEMMEDDLQAYIGNWKKQAQLNQQYYNEAIYEEPVEKKDLFKFDEENPYKEHDDAFKLAVELNEDLKVQDAILALQAHLDKNPEHAPSWRLLGQLYQENDQDDRAIAYFQKAYELDPYDLDSLLYLGVSCTNELQESVALGHLLSWLKCHPDYCDLPFPEGEPSGSKQFRAALRDLFTMAMNKNPSDVDVLVCLGVLEFGQPDYQKASEYFGAAIKENPTDYALWNKFGAALANSRNTEQALDVYDQALMLRPNLVRTWVNTGIAYSSRDRYDIAINKFLNALALNPEAEHVWRHLTRCFRALNMDDKCEMVKKRNIELFRSEYDIIQPNMLPKPSMDKLYDHPHLTS